MVMRKPLANGLLTIGLLAALTSSVKADDFAYMLGAQYGPNVSPNPQTGALTAIGPIGSSVIGNGQGSYARFSVGSSTLYMENAGNLYTINTTTGAGTQVGTTSSNSYLNSVLLFENGICYTGSDTVFGTVGVWDAMEAWLARAGYPQNAVDLNYNYCDPNYGTSHPSASALLDLPARPNSN